MSDSGAGKASGAYYYIIDESFQSASLNILEGVVIMKTLKGVSGLNRVTITDYEDIIGYDLNYNPNYQGLVEMLESVAYLDVLRINYEPYFGNAVFQTLGEGFSNPMTLDPAVLASEVQEIATVATLPSTLGSVAFAKGPIKAGSLELYVGAVLSATDDAAGNLVAVASSGITGTIDYVAGTINAAITGGPTEVNVNFNSDYASSVAFWMNSAGDWGDLAVEMAEYRQTKDIQNLSSVSLGLATEVGSLLLISNDGVQIAHEDAGAWVQETGYTVTGTITRDVDGITSFDLTGPTASSLVVSYVAKDELRTTLYTYSRTSTTTYQLLATEYFSRDPLSTDYLNGKTLTYVSGEIITSVTNDVLDTKLNLLEADNGSMPLASQIDLTSLDLSSAVVVVGNGIVTDSIQSKILEKCDSLKKSFLFDVPNFTNWVDVQAWQLGLYSSEYGQLIWVSDQVETSIGTISVYPSVNLFKTYATMLSDTGYLYYPPAGYDFASIAVESLLETDVTSYADLVKYNKVNYQTTRNSGPVIWEQRTRYGAESDLTYANTVWILRGLSAEMTSFMEQFAFRYTSASSLNLYKTGLESVCQSFQDNGFLWSFSVVTPTWTEVKESGSRVVDIYVNVQVAKDGEVFNLKVVVSSTEVV